MISYQRDWLARHDLRREISNLLPDFDAIVGCEKRILAYFEWDLKFLLPIHFLRLFLANGVLFSKEMVPEERRHRNKEKFLKEKIGKARSICEESLQIADMLLKEGRICLRQEQPSEVAASIVYLARKNILEADSPYSDRAIVPLVWPEEMLFMTRCTES